MDSPYDSPTVPLGTSPLIESPNIEGKESDGCSTPQTSKKGVEHAKKRLRAFSIQKKSPLVTPNTTPVKKKAVTVVIGRLTGVKPSQKPVKDVDSEAQKIPKPPKPGSTKKNYLESYAEIKKKTLVEIETMKKKMELVELGIPLGLIGPDPKSAQCMPTGAMPPIKTFLDPSQLEEIVREAKKARAEGKQYKFDYNKLLPDYKNPFQKQKDEKTTPTRRGYKYNDQRKVKGNFRPVPKHRAKMEHARRVEAFRKERDKVRDKVKIKDRNRSEIKEKIHREHRHNEKPSKRGRETDVNLNDYLVCDSWSAEAEEKSPKQELKDDLKVQDVKSIKEEKDVKKEMVIIEKLKPVVDSYKFEVDDVDDPELDMFDEATDIDKFAKPTKIPLYDDSPPTTKNMFLPLDDGSMSNETYNHKNDETFMESVINEIKLEKMSEDESSHDKHFMPEYDSPKIKKKSESKSRKKKRQVSLTPELKKYDQRSDYSEGYSTESGLKSVESEFKGMESGYSSTDSGYRLDTSYVGKEAQGYAREMCKETADSLDMWNFVLKICQPLLFRHDSNGCYRETGIVPKIWFTENPKNCVCVKDRCVIYQELEIHKMALVDKVYGCDQILEDASPKQRSWYPKRKNCLIDSYLATNLDQGEHSKGPQKQGECSKTPRDQTVQAKGSLDQTEHSKGPRDQGECSKAPRDHTVHAKGPLEQTEQSKGARDQGECSKAPRDQTVHAKGSLEQLEQSKGPRDQGEHAKGPRDQGVHAKGSQDQQAAKPKQVGKRTDTVQEGSATPKYDGKGNSLLLDKEYQRFMDAVMVEANLNKDSGSNTPTKSGKKKGKRKPEEGLEAAEEDGRKAKKVAKIDNTYSSEVWSQESDVEMEDSKSEKRKKRTKRKHSSSSSSDSTKSEDDVVSKKHNKKKLSKKIKSKLEKKRRLEKKKNRKKLIKEKKRERKNTEVDSDDDSSSDNKLKDKSKKNKRKAKKKEQKKRKKRRKSTSTETSNTESDSSSESAKENLKSKKKKKKSEQRKKKKKSEQRKKRRRSSSPHSDEFDADVLRNIKTERLTDDELGLEFCPRQPIIARHEIINVKELQKNLVGIKEEVIEDEKVTSSPTLDVGDQDASQTSQVASVEEGKVEESVQTQPPVQPAVKTVADESNMSQTSSQESVVSVKEPYEKDTSHLRPSSQNSNYSFNDVMKSQNRYYQDSVEKSEQEKYEDANEYEYRQQYGGFDANYEYTNDNQVPGTTVSRIETVVSASGGRGEIKCDWRADRDPRNSAGGRPSRWGLKPGEANIVLTGKCEPSAPVQKTYKIPTISCMRSENPTDSPMTGYDEAYADMYAASDRLQYGDCFAEIPDLAHVSLTHPTGPTHPSRLSLDDRIDKVFRDAEKAEQRRIEVNEQEAAREKGILSSGVKEYVPEKATRANKRVSFADGYKPGQDSDVEQPPKKRRRGRTGCPWPCPLSHRDHVALWDALPPPPPPPGDPPPILYLRCETVALPGLLGQDPSSGLLRFPQPILSR